MIVKPRIRGFICTTAHPDGCAAGVNQQIDYVRRQGVIENATRKALVVGCSGGYGLASRISAAFACGADTLGVSFEKQPSETKTGTAGWYNNVAFERAAAEAGHYAKTLDGDAFSDALKQRVIDTIKEDLGQVDLLIYSLASPVRMHPKTGELARSVIKPLGNAVHIKTLNVDKAVVYEVDLEPATVEETEATITVMGGEDWQFWVQALQEAGVLAANFSTYAYTYIGSELTWPIYWEGTLGRAKEDLDRAAAAIGDAARVAVLKAVVTQASSAIPVVPLYVALLFRVMKDKNLHESCIDHIYRLFATQLYNQPEPRLDDKGRIRMDDVELSEAIQGKVKSRWPLVTTENLDELGDMAGFREDFLKIFGFGNDGVDYDAEQDPLAGTSYAAITSSS